MTPTDSIPPVQLDLLQRIPSGQYYQVYFRSDLLGMREFIAETPEQALALARQFSSENSDCPKLDFYKTSDYSLINEIEVCDDEHNSLAVWHDDDLRLRLAARDLLDAAELVVARWSEGDLAEAVRQLDAAVAKATGGAQ
jgi:hypothetical protein